MYGKVTSFFLTLALIAWNVFDIVRGRHVVLSAIAVGILAFFGFFEMVALSEVDKKPIVCTKPREKKLN